MAGAGLHELERRVTGRVVITSYDLRALSDAEREALTARAANDPGNFVLIDIRPGHAGGDWPLFGSLKLRSFNRLLEFVAESGGEAREFDVAKDLRTGDGGLCASSLSPGQRCRRFSLASGRGWGVRGSNQ